MNYDKKLLEWIQEHADELDDLLEPENNAEAWLDVLEGLCPKYRSGLIIFLMTSLQMGWEEMLPKLGSAIQAVHFSGKLPEELRDVVWPQDAPSCIYKDQFAHSNIRSVQIKKNDLIYIGPRAFEMCDDLTDVHIEHVERLYQACFYSCDNLTEIKIPDGCTIIDLSVFFNCDNLKMLEIPQSVKHIGKDMLGILTTSDMCNYRVASGKTKIKVTGLSKQEAKQWAEDNVAFEDPVTQKRITSKFI